MGPPALQGAALATPQRAGLWPHAPLADSGSLRERYAAVSQKANRVTKSAVAIR